MNRGLAVTAAVLTGGILLGYQNVTSSGARVEVLPPGGGAFAVEGYDPQRLNILGEGFVALAGLGGVTRPSILVSTGESPQTPQPLMAPSAGTATPKEVGVAKPRYDAATFVAKEVAQTALAALLKSNPSGCATKETKSPQPILRTADPKTKVCLGLTDARVTPNGEVQMTPYLPEYLGDLQATLTDAANGAACSQLTGLLQVLGGEMLDEAGKLPGGKHVAVGITVQSGTIQNVCDRHDLPFEATVASGKGPTK